MGKMSQDKGRRAENELVGILRANGIKAERVSRPYAPGPDIVAFNGRYIEAKRRSEPISKTLHSYARDVAIVATRADNDEWYLYIPLYEALDIIGEQRCECHDE